MRRWGWIALGLLVVATIAALVWSLTSDPERPAALVDEPEQEQAVSKPKPLQPKPPAPAPPPPVARPQAPPRPFAPPADPNPLRLVHGSVVTPDGQPAPFAQIVTADTQQRVVSVSDALGQFDVASDVGPVVASHENFGPSDPSTPQHTGHWLLALHPGGKLVGRVVDTQGHGVAQTRVIVTQFRPEPGSPPAHKRPDLQVTDAEGRFEFASVKPGTYDLRAELAGRVPGTSNGISVLRGGRADVVITLPLGASVRGRVTSRQNGQPVANAQVLSADPQASGPGATATTDADGRFEIKGVAPGRVSLRVAHPEYRAELVSGIEVADGAAAQRDVTLVVKQPGEHFAFQGIGASLRRDGDAIVVGSLMDDSPAGRAGLVVGDRIVAVDRGGVEGMQLPQIVERIRGEAGSAVLIEVDRPGQGRITIQVQRGEVVVKDPQ